MAASSLSNLEREWKCSMRRLLGLFWFVLIIGAIIGYSLYLDNAGIVTTGKVSAKQESISVHAGDWTDISYSRFNSTSPAKSCRATRKATWTSLLTTAPE